MVLKPCCPYKTPNAWQQGAPKPTQQPDGQDVTSPENVYVCLWCQAKFDSAFARDVHTRAWHEAKL